jgi:PhzF family phenazine biosynthesis protein
MQVLEFRAFTIDGDPTSGNPAGVVLDASGLGEDEMTGIAAGLGHSETAFVTAVDGPDATVRFFTPLAEIAFCGHATIATSVVLAQTYGVADRVLHVKAGDVPVVATTGSAAFTAVPTPVEPLDPALLAELLAALRLSPDQLDPALPPALVHGGNLHPLVVVGQGVLAGLDHDADAVLALQNRLGWDGTVPVVERIGPTHFASRNPFPRGGIREDPATGSAAAGLGAYLRAGGHIPVPAEIVIDQGASTGRPCRITVEIPADGGIRVRGSAAPL